MQLRIIHRGNEIFTLPLQLDARVIQVKQAIARNMGFRLKDQILTSKGAYLEDEKLLRDYAIGESGSVELHLPLHCHKIIFVTAVDSSDEVFFIPIRDDATVAQLRSAISKQAKDKGIDLSNVSLMYFGRILEDTKRLEDYGVDENACISVVKRLDAKVSPTTKLHDHYNVPKGPGSNRHQEGISLHFQTEGGYPFSMKVNPEKPPKSLAKEVEAYTGIPEENQTYFVSDKQVNLELSPHMLGIKNLENLHIVDSYCGK